MTFKEAQKYLNSFINYENKDSYSYKASFKLERIKEFLDIIGNPQENLKCIHIAGSKGKGSTCAFIAYILREAGFKTGLYTSPHLSDFRERIRILDHRPLTIDHRPEFEGMISKDDLASLVEKLKPAIEKYNKNSEYGPLTFFEVYTALAFVYFKEKKVDTSTSLSINPERTPNSKLRRVEGVDFAVLETGLGGRLDATNIVNPLVCAITSISLEHTHLLGSTLKEIAREKAGIIKNKGQIVVASALEKQALDVIKARCQELEAKLLILNRDFSFKETKSDSSSQTFNFSGIFAKFENLKINLLGKHQIINAATAVACVEALGLCNIAIPKQAIEKGLEQTRWPARFEIIRSAPKIILDAAHNPASAKALKDTWKNLANFHKPVLVFGISNDKDIKGVVKELEGISEKIILTKADNPRATDPEDLRKFFSQNKNIFTTQNTQEAMNLAIKNANKNDAILVTGSLFVVAEVRELCLS